MSLGWKVILWMGMFAFFVALAQNEPVEIMGTNGEKPVDLANLPFAFLGLITLWMAFAAALSIQRSESIEDVSDIEASTARFLAAMWLKTFLLFLGIVALSGLIAAGLRLSYEVASWLVVAGFVVYWVIKTAPNWGKRLWN